MTPTPPVGQIIRVRCTRDWSGIATPDTPCRRRRLDLLCMVEAVHDDGTLDLAVMIGRHSAPSTFEEGHLTGVPFSPRPDADGWYIAEMPWLQPDEDLGGKP